MIWEGKEKRTVACSDIHCDLALLTSSHLVSHLVTSVQSGEREGVSAEIISSLCQKAKRWIGYLRKGIGPLCTLWIIHCNMHGCHTLVLLTFLYVTVKNSFFLLLSIYSQPLSLQLPCSNLALSPQSPAIPRRIGSLSSGAAITAPISLKQKVWCRILENVKFRLYFT